MNLIAAPTNLGLKPYDDGTPRRVNEAPRVLRELGLVERLGARDLGDVPAPPYVDVVRPASGVRNVDGIARHARALADAVASVDRDERLLVLGGDCSITLGMLLGLRRRGRFGAVYVDAHSDVGTLVTTETGGAAGMDLALALARFEHPLARLAPDGPLARAEDVVTLARSDEAWDDVYGVDSPARMAALDLPLARVRALGPDAAARAALTQLERPDLDGFLVHFDVDAIHSSIIPAVDSPEPDGLSLDEAARLLRPLVTSPRCAAVQVTIYDPGLDPERVAGRRIVELLAANLGAATPSGG
ncbi:MAG TPA: arginase family protein [Gemmatimonadaceae bacterium]|nr:arginase family protein [Gemmatimonadaceae bacterium]